ncbi:flavin reductase [Nocardioides luteus]|uniref:flavin reductase n=1 Tax=Nocardioides luteus TaxID=1844 RepID=UPI0018C8FD34|nr:flavin reductase [Nocardioides luteus]MBG6099056.1 flavin reductase (DIM6/NTAB) family NADH-FMN oxidoreductase RutF [Nocardioides luteus]
MLTDVTAQADQVEAVEFRRVLGHFPSGVVAITSRSASGAPAGMVATSFTSVSLDPPLVAFLPQKTSSTFEAIHEAGVFCVNVLSSKQEDVCRALAQKGGEKFADVQWSPATTGSPIVSGAVAWIDCCIETIHDAGDHWIVLGRVVDLAVADPAVPLLFFQGGYGRFQPQSVSAVGAPDLVEQLRVVDIVRPAMIDASRRLGVEVLATAQLGNELVTVASSGHPDPERLPTRIGQRMPYIPPLGVLFAADTESEEWIARAGLDEAGSAHVRELVDRVRARGWSATLGATTTHDLERALARMSTHEPTAEQRRAVEEAIDPLGGEFEPEDLVAGVEHALRTVAVPLTDRSGAVRLVLTAYGLPESSTRDDFLRYRDELIALAASIDLPSVPTVAAAS